MDIGLLGLACVRHAVFRPLSPSPAPPGFGIGKTLREDSASCVVNCNFSTCVTHRTADSSPHWLSPFLEVAPFGKRGQVVLRVWAGLCITSSRSMGVARAATHSSNDRCARKKTSIFGVLQSNAPLSIARTLATRSRKQLPSNPSTRRKAKGRRRSLQSPDDSGGGNPRSSTIRRCSCQCTKHFSGVSGPAAFSNSYLVRRF